LNRTLELIRCNFGVKKLNYNEPQFFFVIMDYQLACVNVHWLSAPAEGGQYNFYIERLSKHFLDDANGIRVVMRAAKNIFNYGLNIRLQKLCEVLDAYRKRVILEREIVIIKRN
jgi:hypothetical protein